LKEQGAFFSPDSYTLIVFTCMQTKANQKIFVVTAK
jgi:hypothetical protein